MRWSIVICRANLRVGGVSESKEVSLSESKGDTPKVKPPATKRSEVCEDSYWGAPLSVVRYLSR